MTLDEIAAAAEQLKRQQQQENVARMVAEKRRAVCAKMADEIERIKAEDWKAPEGVEHVPTFEKPAPADWLLQELFAKAKREGETHHMELDTD